VTPCVLSLNSVLGGDALPLYSFEVQCRDVVFQLVAIVCLPSLPPTLSARDASRQHRESNTTHSPPLLIPCRVIRNYSDYLPSSLPFPKGHKRSTGHFLPPPLYVQWQNLTQRGKRESVAPLLGGEPRCEERGELSSQPLE